jgi:DNA primase catalytic core
MGLIKEMDLERVKDASDLLGVATEYLGLTFKRSGKNSYALCPFHAEKTPSFSVNPDKGIWKCFGCGRGGNVFNLVMAARGMTFPDAVRELARRASIDLEFSESDKREHEKRQPAYDVLERACILYEQQLSEHPAVQEYLRGRGIEKETVESFRIGYAPDWDMVYDEMGEEVGTGTLQQAGLIRAYSGGFSDFMRGRVIFPICDSLGRVIAFGGRTLTEVSHSNPKYLNTSDTPLFSKERTFFGFHHALRAIAESKKLVVVEGYTDVVLSHQVGLEYCLSVIGTSFTKPHLGILKSRFPDAEWVFCYDGDESGHRAAVRTSEMLIGEGNVSICTLPPEQDDPADIVKKEGKRGLELVFEKRKPLFDFYIDSRIGSRKLTSPEQQIAFLRDMRRQFLRIPPDSRRAYLDALCSRTGVSPDSAQSILFTSHGLSSLEDSLSDWQERLLTGFVCYPGTIESLGGFVSESMFDNPTRRVLYKLVMQEHRNPTGIVLHDLQHGLFSDIPEQQLVDEARKLAGAENLRLDATYLLYLIQANHTRARPTLPQMKEAVIAMRTHDLPARFRQASSNGKSLSELFEIARDTEDKLSS